MKHSICSRLLKIRNTSVNHKIFRACDHKKCEYVIICCLVYWIKFIEPYNTSQNKSFTIEPLLILILYRGKIYIFECLLWINSKTGLILKIVWPGDDYVITTPRRLYFNGNKRQNHVMHATSWIYLQHSYCVIFKVFYATSYS